MTLIDRKQTFTLKFECLPTSYYFQELRELLAKSKEAEENLEVAKQKADEQKKSYEELQAKHSKQLDEIRQAGHDALAVIVEEYKVIGTSCDSLLACVSLP